MLTGAAVPGQEIQAMLSVNDRHVGHGLGEGGIDIAPSLEAHVEIQEQGPWLLIGHVLQLDGPCRADKSAGPAGNTILRELIERRGHLPLHSSSHKADGADPNQILAHSHAQATQDAVVLLEGETRLLDAQLSRQLLEQRDFRAAGQQQLHDHPPPFQHLLRGSEHLDLVADGVIAGSDQPRPSPAQHFHRAQPTDPVGLQGLVMTQRGDGDIQLSRCFQDGGILLDLDFPPVYNYANHSVNPFIEDFYTPCADGSRRILLAPVVRGISNTAPDNPLPDIDTDPEDL